MIEICRSGTSICDPVLEGKGAVVDALDSHELYETEAAGAQSFDHVQVLQLGVLHQIVNDAFRFIRHLKINPFLQISMVTLGQNEDINPLVPTALLVAR